MEKIALITDSTCGLPVEYIYKYNIHVVRLKIIYKDREYIDGITISADEFYSKIEEELPTTSMPSVQDVSDLYEKLIICGTGGKNPLSSIGLLLTSFLKASKGERYISKTVLNMAFGAYNRKFEGNSKYDWLTKDKTIIEKYANDKYCTFSFTVSAMYDLITLNSVCNKKNWYKEISKTLPILLISGEDDPVGNYGKGVTQVFNDLKNSGADATIKLYPDCRHEILNDTCKEEVISDIVRFIKE